MTNNKAVRFGDVAVMGGDASARSHLGANPTKHAAEGVWRVFTRSGHGINDVIVCPNGDVPDWQPIIEDARALLHWPPKLKPEPMCIIIKPTGGVLPPIHPMMDLYVRAGANTRHVKDPRTLEASHFTNDKPHWLARLGDDNWLVVEHP